MIVEFNTEALDEFNRAEEWYRNQSTNAAKRFVQQVKQANDKIVADPQQFQRLKGGFQRCRLRKFPFSIIYRCCLQKLSSLQLLTPAGVPVIGGVVCKPPFFASIDIRAARANTNGLPPHPRTGVPRCSCAPGLFSFSSLRSVPSPRLRTPNPNPKRLKPRHR
jgi:plasmid stabilization system protein ParE